MDKYGRNRTITIKIDGKNRSFQKEESKASHSLADNLEEMKGFEQVDEETLLQSAVAEEDEFDWVLPDLEEVPKKSKNPRKSSMLASPNKKYNRKKKGRPPAFLPTVALTVFIAVLLGTSLGIFMLKMVTTDSITEPVGNPVEESPSIEVATPVPTTSVSLPIIQASIVQGGAFSTIEAANSEASSFSAKGLPAKALDLDGNALLFIGIANNLSNAKALGEKLQNNGFETFAKDIQINGLTLSNIKDSEKELLQMTPSLYQLLIEMATTASLSQSVPAPLVETFHDQKAQWEGMEPPEKQKIKLLKRELDGAVTNLYSFIETKDERILTAVQQHLLEFLEKYQNLSSNQ